MTSVVVDTNVLVSFITDRDDSQQKKADALIRAAASRELALVVHQQVVSELIYVLLNLYGQRRESISGIISDLLLLPGVCTADVLEWSRVLDLWPQHFPDFADAVLAATCRLGRHDAIATFDETFKARLSRLELRSYW